MLDKQNAVLKLRKYSAIRD